MGQKTGFKPRLLLTKTVENYLIQLLFSSQRVLLYLIRNTTTVPGQEEMGFYLCSVSYEGDSFDFENGRSLDVEPCVIW